MMKLMGFFQQYISLNDLFQEYVDKNVALILIEDTGSNKEKIFIKSVLDNAPSHIVYGITLSLVDYKSCRLRARRRILGKNFEYCSEAGFIKYCTLNTTH